MDGIKLPFLIEVWVGEYDDGEGNLEPSEVRYRFNMDSPKKVRAFFDKFLKNSLDTTLKEHRFTDLNDYVLNQTGASLEDLELVAGERIWKQTRFSQGGRINYADFMKRLRVGYENQLPSKTLEVQGEFVISLMNELLYNESGQYPHLENLLCGGSPFGNIAYGAGGYFNVCEFDDWQFRLTTE